MSYIRGYEESMGCRAYIRVVDVRARVVKE
jgi:hypothetical protein